MVLITIVTGAYKPTNITGGPHIVDINSWMVGNMFLNDGNSYGRSKAGYRVAGPTSPLAGLVGKSGTQNLIVAIRSCLIQYQVLSYTIWGHAVISWFINPSNYSYR